MKIGIPKEIEDGELRVAMTPAVAERVKQLGFGLVIESGAGEAASYSDDAYLAAGVEVTSDTKALWHDSDILIKVRPPIEHPELGFYGIELLGKNQTLISTLYPAQNSAKLNELAARGTNAVALDAVPRISRAQKMDVLSSMANIAGYRAVVEAAQHFGRFFTGQITAAGKVPPWAGIWPIIIIVALFALWLFRKSAFKMGQPPLTSVSHYMSHIQGKIGEKISAMRRFGAETG